jgi:hypothetical protein
LTLTVEHFCIVDIAVDLSTDRLYFLTLLIEGVVGSGDHLSNLLTLVD